MAAGTAAKSRPTTRAGRDLAAAGREARKCVNTAAFAAYFRAAAVHEPADKATDQAQAVIEDILGGEQENGQAKETQQSEDVDAAAAKLQLPLVAEDPTVVANYAKKGFDRARSRPPDERDKHTWNLALALVLNESSQVVRDVGDLKTANVVTQVAKRLHSANVIFPAPVRAAGARVRERRSMK